MESSICSEAGADRLLDHIEAPHHKGTLRRSNCVATERNPRCGDQIRLQLLIDNGRIREAWFDGRGCAISQAAASMLCEWVEGQRVAAAERLQPEQLLTLLGTPISPMRQRCALLAFQALMTLLRPQQRP